MNGQDIARLKALFAQAADLPGSDRGAFLDAACPSEPEFRAKIERLLAYDSGCALGQPDQGFLDSPLVIGAAGEPVPGAVQTGRDGQAHPSRIGRYRIVRWHGEGGMGTVYEAEQDNPRRMVALKVIRSGFPTREMVNRFQHEGRFWHGFSISASPRSMKLTCAKTDTRSSPWSLSAACPWTSSCAVAAWCASECLELLARVCDAVQHGRTTGASSIAT